MLLQPSYLQRSHENFVKPSVWLCFMCHLLFQYAPRPHQFQLHKDYTVKIRKGIGALVNLLNHSQCKSVMARL